MSFPWLRKITKKRSDSSSGRQFLKIFIFPCKPSGEVCQSEGGGRTPERQRESTGSLKAAGQECALPDLVCLGFTTAEHKLG